MYHPKNRIKIATWAEETIKDNMADGYEILDLQYVNAVTSAEHRTTAYILIGKPIQKELK